MEVAFSWYGQGGSSFPEIQNGFLVSLRSEQGQMATTKPITGEINWHRHHSVSPPESLGVTHSGLNETGVCWLGGGGCDGSSVHTSIIIGDFSNALAHQHLKAWSFYPEGRVEQSKRGIWLKSQVLCT